jgi:hypothetical protein
MSRLRPVIGLLLGLAVCGALAVAAAGCGSSSALDPVAQAAQDTQREGGSRMLITASIGVPGAGSSISLSGRGYFNYRSKEGTFTMSMSGLPGISQLSSSGELNIDERIKGATVWVGSDLFAGKLPGGARWAKLDLNRFTGGAYGLDLQQLTAGQSNPAQILDYLKASSGGVQVVGHERVRGVETTRYRGTLDLEKLADQAPASVRAKAHEAIAKLVEKTGQRFVPVEAWVDAQNRVRRFTLSMTVSQSGESVTVAMKVELYGYGPTPPVATPSDSESYDLTQAALSGLPPT